MEIGQKLPEILGKDQDCKEIKLSDFKGKKLVLYTYPKDSTPGCTSEACSLRDNYQRFLDNGYAVVGVSVQDEKSQVSAFHRRDGNAGTAHRFELSRIQTNQKPAGFLWTAYK